MKTLEEMVKDWDEGVVPTHPEWVAAARQHVNDLASALEIAERWHGNAVKLPTGDAATVAEYAHDKKRIRELKR